MSENIHVRNDQIVNALASSIRKGSSGLHNVPGLLKQIIRDGMWRERTIEATGELVTFRYFGAFVEADPPDGLGADTKTLQRLCNDDPEALDLLDQALKGRQGERTDLVDSIHDVAQDDRPTGTSRAAGLRRLRKDRPDLHERVIANDISVNAAMVEAGFRKQTITVPIDTEAAAAAILRHFTPEQVADLVARLLSLKTDG